MKILKTHRDFENLCEDEAQLEVNIVIHSSTSSSSSLSNRQDPHCSLTLQFSNLQIRTIIISTTTTSSYSSPQLFSSAYQNSPNSSLHVNCCKTEKKCSVMGENSQKQNKSLLLWEWIPKNRISVLLWKWISKNRTKVFCWVYGVFEFKLNFGKAVPVVPP